MIVTFQVVMAVLVGLSVIVNIKESKGVGSTISFILLGGAIILAIIL